MCKSGCTRRINPIYHNPTFGDDVDECLADFLQLLNDYGIATVASCCGHGRESPYLVAKIPEDRLPHLVKIVEYYLGWDVDNVCLFYKEYAIYANIMTRQRMPLDKGVFLDKLYMESP